MRSKEKFKTNKKDLIKDLIKARNAVKKKFQAIKTGRVESESQLEETFKPITKPLQELVKKVKYEPREEIKFEPKEERSGYDDFKLISKEAFPKMEAASTPIKYADYSLMSDEFATPTRSTSSTIRSVVDPNKYLQLYINKNHSIDPTYGVYLDENKWKLGNATFDFDDGGDIIIKGKKYKGTIGLYELIFMKMPVKTYTEQDLSNYKAILEETNAHRRDHSADGQIKGNKGFKYKEIISRFNPHEGGSLMKIPKGNTDYIYWNDPNELIDRLRLLIASQNAGHNNHNNEIMSIIEELRESDIIE